jgi:hypothetical protein
LKMHTQQGENYCGELYERLTKARTTRMPHSLSSSPGVPLGKHKF